MMRCGVATGKHVLCGVDLSLLKVEAGGVYVLNDVTARFSRGPLCIIALLYTRLE